MSAIEVVQGGWARHAEAPEDVFAAAVAAVPACEPEAAAPLGALLFHVGCEHLGRFAEVGTALDALVGRAEAPEAVRALHRSRAALALIRGDVEGAAVAEALAAEGDPRVVSGTVRALAASALAGQRRIDEAARWFAEALAHAEQTGTALARSVAITANNIAVTLEERDARGAAEDALMLAAAEAARRWWELGGGWLQVERAEVRLAMTRIARGEAAEALRHARQAQQIVEGHGGDAGELLFVNDALARAYRLAGDLEAARAHRDEANALLGQIREPGFQMFAAEALVKLDALLG